MPPSFGVVLPPSLITSYFITQCVATLVISGMIVLMS